MNSDGGGLLGKPSGEKKVSYDGCLLIEPSETLPCPKAEKEIEQDEAGHSRNDMRWQTLLNKKS